MARGPGACDLQHGHTATLPGAAVRDREPARLGPCGQHDPCRELPVRCWGYRPPLGGDGHRAEHGDREQLFDLGCGTGAPVGAILRECEPHPEQQANEDPHGPVHDVVRPRRRRGELGGGDHPALERIRRRAECLHVLLSGAELRDVGGCFSVEHRLQLLADLARGGPPLHVPELPL